MTLPKLRVGEVVWCDPTVRARYDATPDVTLQGWSSRGEGGVQLARHFHDGLLAERMIVPTENVESLADVDEENAAHWSAIGVPLVPYGGLLAVGQPGETVLVSGATGNFGSAGVAVALAMGAAQVIAVGRNELALKDLQQRFGERVRTVILTGDGEHDTQAMKARARHSIDVVLDLLPPSAGAAPFRAAALSVRDSGRIALMGGVGMLGGDDLALPYPWLMRNLITLRGQWMAPRAANGQLIALAYAGMLDLNQDSVTTFGLDEVNAAVAHAAAHPGPFMRTIVIP